MSVTCDLCNDAGRLRDGAACPWCNMTRWQTVGSIEAVTRPKRQAWVRTSSQSDIVRSEVPARTDIIAALNHARGKRQVES
jgi:hypothetical protein